MTNDWPTKQLTHIFWWNVLRQNYVNDITKAIFLLRRMHMSTLVNHRSEWFVDLSIPLFKFILSKYVGHKLSVQFARSVENEICMWTKHSIGLVPVKKGNCYKALTCNACATKHSVRVFSPVFLTHMNDKRAYVSASVSVSVYCFAVHRPHSTFSTEAISLIIFMQT